MSSGDDQYDGQAPAYGHGFEARPLWSVRDRDAEQLRELLRRRGFVEFTEGGDGFVVEHPDDEGPMLLVHTRQPRSERVAAEQDYGRLLEQAGYRFAPNATGDGEGWRVRPQPAAAGDTSTDGA
ncbi:hypothetical protein WHI96_25035 [Pseudonocardia tropica]|uniref:Uncharacterized protein n=1 Tax=Pseudonocardia tropica TaxID=681289 RepID=A0ABV1K4R0_9PSEU